ncbi:MAG TPA: hypothetical protein VK255_04215, partial [Patescibacteria group bacterium]|nr:hypothetical protein [Patescibacteria group bacterium]
MNDISQNNLTSIDTQPNFSSKRPEIGSIPIHTMKKDLENINNPGSVEEDGSLDPPHEPKQSFLQTPQSQPRTSPFLSQDTQREVSNIPVPIDERVSDELTPHSPSNWGKLIFVACLIFLLFAVATGGYYYWMNKKNTQKSTENTVITPPKQLLATDKPNYLNVDINADKINLLSATDKYIREIKEENANSPIEFQVVDSQNNPILFKNFAAKIGITLTSEITSNL